VLHRRDWAGPMRILRLSVDDPLGRLAPSGPHLWDAVTTSLGVAAGRGVLGQLVAGARRSRCPRRVPKPGHQPATVRRYVASTATANA
jgi:hypothetical protein